MNGKTITMAGNPAIRTFDKRMAKPRMLERIVKRALTSRLRGLRHGRVVLHDAAEHLVFGALSAEFPVEVQLRVDDPRFYTFVAFRGHMGAGEAFVNGWWTTDDLVGLMRIMTRNIEVLDSLETGLARLTAPLQAWFHWQNRNTLKGSKKNIAAHYDLGNDFYSLMLDPTMMYSSAIFDDEHNTLWQAQKNKLERIFRKLELKPTDHLVEIGTGWGGMAIHAASAYGCRVTTTTISREQYDLARSRVRAAGLEDRVTVLFEDYRNLTGKYNKLVSIEMIEAVGHENFDTFFAKCSELLTDDGLMVLQGITIADRVWERYLKEVDWIQRYVFPGSCLLSMPAVSASLARATDLRFQQLEDLTPHYRKTINHWRANFWRNIDQVRAQGFDERFIRLWEFYLGYCEGGFAERYIGDLQLTLAKPNYRGVTELPALSAPAPASRAA